MSHCAMEEWASLYISRDYFGRKQFLIIRSEESSWRESMESVRAERALLELCEELSELCKRHGDDAQM